MQWRELALDFIFHREVQLRGFVGLAMPQSCPRFARVVIAVMKEENNFAADFLLGKIRTAAGRNK
jgi:hypothetical protein